MRMRKLSRPGYPVVIEYECDQNAEEKYKYFSGPREALCDDKGTWTLPAMYCIPAQCYSSVPDGAWRKSILYSRDIHEDKKGRECQAWKEDTPHPHPIYHKLEDGCPGCGSVEDIGNKCRGMDYDAKPWCYLKHIVRWELCDVPECKKERRCARPPLLRGAPALRTELIGQKVHVTYRCHADLKYISGRNVSICDMETGVWEWPNLLCASDKCFYYDRNQWNKLLYHGNLTTTKTGRTCQRWDAQMPHKHKTSVFDIPGVKSLSEVGNTCQDPDNTAPLWCYTTDPGWEKDRCSLPECKFH